ncbi:MAG: phosphoribosylformylglycinamidine synthase [bacterium]
MILTLQSSLDKQKYYVLEFQTSDRNPAQAPSGPEAAMKSSSGPVPVSGVSSGLDPETLDRIAWLFQARPVSIRTGLFIGPRREMVTPWSTNAVEILKNTGISGIIRAEEFMLVEPSSSSGNQPPDIDPMLQEVYHRIDDQLFAPQIKPVPVRQIEDIAAYNREAGLALSDQEVDYLTSYARKAGRHLTDAELFGFAQANSEHCRHKIFKGKYVLDGQVQQLSLFDWIRQTSLQNPANIVSAYSDNVAFFKGPVVEQFAPDESGRFRVREIESTLSLKAETHNFPTTVCAFPGAATGTGGEIRDRMGGGIGSLPGVGTAGYLTSYARMSDLPWEDALPAREYLYQDPATILIQASNGASDYGNKFGQPLIAGTVTTFEHTTGEVFWGFDKVIMLAGGVGQANIRHAHKKVPARGDRVILLGGDNYRIGIAGGSVSSVNTGEMEKKLELNAVQRANAEMQQRVYRVLRALAEDADHNPVVSLHDHGAGGHFNCFSELLEQCGGVILMDRLPLGDPTLSDLEIIGNESQERMGLIVPESAVERILKIADRERCPCFVVGTCTGDGRLVFQWEDRHALNGEGNNTPVDLDLKFLFGNPPKTETRAETIEVNFPPVTIPEASLEEHLRRVLRLTKVASKEWLTHKADRSVTGLVAQQQTVGPCQLPLSDVAVKALDYTGNHGLALGMGDNPICGLVSPEAGARMSVAEALLNIVFAPLVKGLDSVVLSANWMWPYNQPGEKASLYRAVRALGEVCLGLGIAVPTGKDSLSMSQQYPSGMVVRSPGTVIVTAAGWCDDLTHIVTPDLQRREKTGLAYIPFQKLPDDPSACLGTSSLAQVYNQLGGSAGQVPDLRDPRLFKTCFNTIQMLLGQGLILAGHDVSTGGIITALCEMAFAGNCGLEINFPDNMLFFEGPGVIIQYPIEAQEKILAHFTRAMEFYPIARPDFDDLTIRTQSGSLRVGMEELRRVWQKTSYEMERLQMNPAVADEGFAHFGTPLKSFAFPADFDPMRYPRPAASSSSPLPVRAAIIREKGTNGDREMAYALHMAGFEVRDVTTTDITCGRETLSDIGFIVFCGGFSNSDVLGSARGWAGIFRYNQTARTVLRDFYQRQDTLSLGICNGCQLMTQLNLIYPAYEESKQPKLLPNRSNIFESRFLTVDIAPSPAILLQGLEGSCLGIWVAHGEGRFSFGGSREEYIIPVTYSAPHYPANPNGSQFEAAAICSADGRHLAMMPHPERALFPWQWGYYPPAEKGRHPVTPWVMLFANARNWIQARQGGK